MTDSFDDAPPGETTYSQARATNEVIKVKKARVQLENLKAEYIDLLQAQDHCEYLFHAGREAWTNQIDPIVKSLTTKLKKRDEIIRPLMEQGITSQIQSMSTFRLQFA